MNRRFEYMELSRCTLSYVDSYAEKGWEVKLVVEDGKTYRDGPAQLTFTVLLERPFTSAALAARGCPECGYFEVTL